MTVRPIGATAGDVPLGRTVAISRWASFWRRNGTGYAFLTPWMLGFFLLTIGPALVSLYLSFTDFNLLQAPTWIGDANYVRIFTNDPKFLQAVRVTFFYAVVSVPLKLAFALAVAMALNRGLRACRSTARSSTCPRCSARASPSLSCGASFSPATG